MTRRALLTLSAITLACAGLAAAPSPVQPMALLYPGRAESPSGVSSGFLLGGWSAAGGWQSPRRTAAAWPGRVRWRLQGLTGPARTVQGGGPVTFGAAPCEDTGLLTLPAPPRAGAAQLATSAALKRRPRPVEALPLTSKTYQAAVRQQLVQAGLSNPTVRLTALARADLDGNGTQEVLIAASRFQEARTPLGAPPHARAGDYSLLLLRWTDRKTVFTKVMAARIFPRNEKEGEWLMPERFDLVDVADLNSDGRMELVVSADYYEGSSAAVFEWSPGAGLQERLNAGCGA